jgi:glycosyltransferase involved in cell wall biosynthesis
MAAHPLPISIIILTYNEEQNIADCLLNLAGWAGEVFVVDSGSTDGTLGIVEEFGAAIIHHPFETHARQWAWALANVPYTNAWIFGLDADQRVTPELRDELAQLFGECQAQLAGIDGLYVKRRQIFRGSWIRHGGYYPKYLLKLFRPGAVQIDERDLIDHHFYVAGRTARLQHDIVEDNRKERDIAFWIAKHNRYATLHAREEQLRRRDSQAWPIRAALFGSPDQRVIWLKSCWYRLPLYIRPFIYFFYRYVLRLGFLDGKQGFIFHFLQGFWYRLLVDIHLDELMRAADHGVDLSERAETPVGAAL